MIVFYKEHSISNPIIPIAKTCDTACATSCLKPKSKCCNKYKKKGINCKRCPLTFEVKIAS